MRLLPADQHTYAGRFVARYVEWYLTFSRWVSLLLPIGVLRDASSCAVEHRAACAHQAHKDRNS